MKYLKLIASIGLVSLGACASSPPTQFFTLDVVPGERQSSLLNAPVQVGTVHIPAMLDRQEIVRASGPDRLTVSNQHRWGAPLGEMIRRVLTQDLLDRLHGSAIILPDQPAPPNTRTIVIDILKFEADASGRVVLQGSWSLVSQGSNTPSASRRVQIEEPASNLDYPTGVQAMSRAVGRLADKIAGVLAQTNRAAHPRSPTAADDSR